MLGMMKQYKYKYTAVLHAWNDEAVIPSIPAVYHYSVWLCCSNSQY